MLSPARITPGPRGPFSADYQDSYHGALGGLAQARDVFLALCDLPRAWRGQPCHTVVETGFGLGINFLATWQAWRADPERPDRLHFLSIERHPVALADLAAAHASAPDLAPLARQLRACLPLPVAGAHRLCFEQGRVNLTLVYGDGAAALAELDARADSVFLDGFAPDRNPALWQPAVFAELARLARPAARLASWCTAGAVRRALAASGFDVQRRPGTAGKFEILQGTRRMESASARAAGVTASAGRSALVIGAGLAGTTLTAALTERGWTVDLFDAAVGPGMAASGNPAGVVRPLWSRDDNAPTRLTRAAFLHAVRRWAQPGEGGRSAGWHPTGVLQLAADAAQATQWAADLAAQDWPAELVQWLDARAAQALTGQAQDHGGLLFPLGGWAEPAVLCANALAAAHGSRLRCHWRTTVATLAAAPDGSGWRALAGDGTELAQASHVVVCTGAGLAAIEVGDALPASAAPPDGGEAPAGAAVFAAHDSDARTARADFTPADWRPLQALRGETLQLPAAAAPPALVLCGDGYVCPAPGGEISVGATYDRQGPATPTAAGAAENLARLARLSGAPAAPAVVAQAAGRVAWRSVAADRLPVVGADPHLAGLWHLRALASRGIVWSALMAETLACAMHGEPSPLLRSQQTLILPQRRVLRRRE